MSGALRFYVELPRTYRAQPKLRRDFSEAKEGEVMRRSNVTSPSLSPRVAAPARSKSGGFFLAWWMTYLIASPFYVVASGLPQPADGLLAVMIAVLATGYALRIPVYYDLYLAGALFLSWVAVVNWFWWAQYYDIKFLLSSVYYVYNFAVLLAVITLFNRLQGRFLSATCIALIIAVMIELLFIVFWPTGRMRSTGTFNNPNQLGYFSILAGACYIVARGESSLRWRDLAVLCALAYISMLSLSKAAMLSFLALFGAALWFQGTSMRMKLALCAAVVFGALFIVAESSVLDTIRNEGASAAALKRLENIGKQDDDSAAGRGYDRIWLYPEYMLLGAGEGAFDRFDASMKGGNEMHSTFGTVFFSYGLLGVAFFLFVLWCIFRRAGMRYLAYFLPVFLYGLTHQGLRFSLLWVFLGLIFCVSRRQYDVSVAPQPSTGLPLNRNAAQYDQYTLQHDPPP